jgi:hypothetical protein
MSQLKKYFHIKRISVQRDYIPAKGVRIKNTVKKMLQDQYKRKYKKKRCITNQATYLAIFDRVEELLQDGKF